MANETSIPALLKSTVRAYVEVEDERMRASNPLLNIREVTDSASQIEIRTKTMRRKAPLLTSADGQGFPVEPHTLESKYYDPAWSKPFGQISGHDVAAFQAFDPADAVNSVAGSKIADTAEELARSNSEFRKLLIFGAMQGSVTGSFPAPGGTDFTRTVSYGFTTLTQPSTVWTNAAATILADIRDAINEYRSTVGERPTHILYRASALVNAFAQNTDIINKFGSVERLMATFLEIAQNPVMGNVFGESIGLAGLTWIPVDDIYDDRSDSQSYHWDGDYITLCNLGMARPEFVRWAHPMYINGPGMNVEVMEPQPGQAVKSFTVQGYDNGLVSFRRPDVMTRLRVAGF